MAKHTRATARTDGRGHDELTVQQQESDSPNLPVAQLEQLHSFRPDGVDWYFSQTQVESDHRRSQQAEVNKMIFSERKAGQRFAFLMGLVAVGGGCLLVLKGHDWAGVSVSGGAIISLAAAFLAGRPKK